VTKCQITFTRRAVLFIKFISCIEVSNHWCRKTSHVSIYFTVFRDIITDWRHVHFFGQHLKKYCHYSSQLTVMAERVHIGLMILLFYVFHSKL